LCQRERGVVSSTRSALLSATEGIREELREIKAALTTIASALTKELDERPRHHHLHADAKLLSLREAARRLGVDRSTTLRGLIRTGQLGIVEVNGKHKVPASEVERLAQVRRVSEAHTPPPLPLPVPDSPRRTKKARVRRSPRASGSQSIRELKF
jgi:excisionase family DNA binding protein